MVLFVLGLILCISGFVLYLRSPKRFVEYESEDLGSIASTISSERSTQVVWFNPQTLGYFASNLTLTVKVDSPDGKSLLYILNESQFEVWQPNQAINQSFMSKTVLNELNFSFEPDVSETYHFIAENPSNATIHTSVSLSLSGDFLRFDYSLMPLYVALFSAGTITCLALRKNFLSWFDEFLRNWSSPMYKKLGETEYDKEEAKLRFASMSSSKRLAKYFLLVEFCVIVAFYLYAALSVASDIAKWNSIRPEYSVLLFDSALRSITLGVLSMLPLVAGIPVLFIFIGIRLLDLEDVVKSKIGLEKKRTRKQLEIDKHMLRKVVEASHSSRFLLPCALLLALLLLIRSSPLWEMLIVQVGYFTLVGFTLGISLGYIAWSSFQKVCEEQRIGKYAADRHRKIQIVDFAITIPLYTIYTSLLGLFIFSDFWTSTLRSFVFESVTLLKPFYVLGELSTLQLVGFSGIFSIVLAMTLGGFLFFVLFPFFHRMGPKGVFGAFLAFGLAYITEFSVAWVLGETVVVVIQPLGTVTPIVAAIVSWIAQNKYEKMIKKGLIRV